jgi:sugar phosphate permease
VALALAGIGIGTTVVPITTSVLSAVPPERSGMAASASNTSREIGAVTGVAVLGSLVYSQLHASLVAQMNHLGVPKAFQGLVVNAIETGQIPQNTGAYAGFGKLVQEVIGAAYTAFHDGLRAALYLSAALVLVAALLSFITLRSRPVNTGS